MNELELKKLNDLTEEIRDIEYFLMFAKKLWTGKIRKEKYILFANAHGAIGSKELHLKNELKNEILEVVEKYVEKLKKERGF